MFSQDFLADRGRHLAAKLRVTRTALKREGILLHSVLYKLGVIEEIIAAQNRIVQGTYGYCVDCGESISNERLLRYPHVARCVSCQSEKEKS